MGLCETDAEPGGPEGGAHRHTLGVLESPNCRALRSSSCKDYGNLLRREWEIPVRGSQAGVRGRFGSFGHSRTVPTLRRKPKTAQEYFHAAAGVRAASPAPGYPAKAADRR